MANRTPFQIEQARLAGKLKDKFGLCFTKQWTKATKITNNAVCVSLAVEDNDATGAKWGTYEIMIMPTYTTYGSKVIEDWSHLIMEGDYVLVDAILGQSPTDGEDIWWNSLRVRDIRSPSMAWKQLTNELPSVSSHCNCQNIVSGLIGLKKPVFKSWCESHKLCLAELFKTIVAKVTLAREDLERKDDLKFSDLVDTVQKYYKHANFNEDVDLIEF
jgi:hypothetical protein